MSMDTEIRTTLHQAVEATDAPTIDRVGFERRVRWHRRRRRAGMAGAVAAVAAAVLAVPLAVNQIGSGPKPANAPVAGSPSANPPAYFTVGRQVMAISPRGQVLQLGQFQARWVVGPTAEGVLLLDREGRLMNLAVTWNGDEWTAKQLEAPPVGPFGFASVSDDGSRVAVVDGSEDLVIYDLESGQPLDRVPFDDPTPGAPDTGIADFSDRPLYVHDSVRWLGTGGDTILIPRGDGRQSVGGDVVAVPELGDSTRMYDVSGGTAVEIDRLPGYSGDLSGDGRYYLTVPEDIAADAIVRDLDTQRSHPLAGLEDLSYIGDVRWLDDDTALLTARTLPDDESAGLLFVCEAATARCQPVFDAGPRSVGLW
jgi:hypothetical protein